MRHIGVSTIDGRSIVIAAKCGAAFVEGDDVVTAALESNCDVCRVAVMVQPVAWSKPVLNDKNEVVVPSKLINVRMAPNYTPEPMEGADEIVAEAKAKRDGR